MHNQLVALVTFPFMPANRLNTAAAAAATNVKAQRAFFNHLHEAGALHSTRLRAVLEMCSAALQYLG